MTSTAIANSLASTGSDGSDIFKSLISDYDTMYLNYSVKLSVEKLLQLLTRFFRMRFAENRLTRF